MAAAVHTLQISQGASYVRTLTIYAPGEPNTPIDLTGATVKAEVREAHKKPLVAAFSCEIVDPPAEGKVTFGLSPEQTAALSVNKRYRWDIFIRYAGGVVDKLIEGEVIVDPYITQNP